MNAPNSPAAPFSQQQKEYLQGFAAGVAAAGALGTVGAGVLGSSSGAPSPPEVAARAEPASWFGWPLDEITREEQLKREQNPLDIWDKLVAHAQENRPPQGGDVYRFKFHGLFYVAPAQDSLMVRVRIPGNALSSAQMRRWPPSRRIWRVATATSRRAATSRSGRSPRNTWSRYWRACRTVR